MNSKQIQSLNIGDKITVRGIPAIIKDWKCNLTPTFHSDGGRIDAEPIVTYASGITARLHPMDWNDTNIASAQSRLTECGE